MAQNFDDFDDQPPSLDDGMVVESDAPAAEEQSPRASIAETLKTNPAFKIFLIIIAVGAVVSAALGVFSSSAPERETPSIVGQPGELTSVPGGQASPAFQQAVVEASKQRAQGAVQSGGSALPTPLGGQTQITTLDPNDSASNNDPLSEFRADAIEPPAPKAADVPPAVPPPATYNPYGNAAPAVGQPATYDTQGLTQSMQQQMQTLIGAWQPSAPRVMTVTAPSAAADNTAPPAPTPEQQQQGQGKMLVQAGTINYGEMIMEANSDIPGPVLARISSGPFAGAKAIGSFQSSDDFLVIRFSNITFQGKDYPVDILAINPDTTLGGLATEVDHRYWSRVIWPAAADFLTGFATNFSQADQSVSVQDGVIVSTRAGASLRRGFGEGLSQAGQQFSDILKQQGANTKPLVKVHAGTPIGLFFVSSVFENQQPNQTVGYGGYGAGGYGNNNPYNLNGVNGFGGYGQQQGTGIPITQLGQQQYGSQFGNNAQNYGLQGYNNPYNTGANGYNGYNTGGGVQLPSGIQVIQGGTNRQPTYIGQ